MTTLFLIVALVLAPATGENHFELSVKTYPTEEACKRMLPTVEAEYAQRGLTIIKLECAATKAGGLST